MTESVKCHRKVKRDNDIKGPINSSSIDAISDISKNHFSGAWGQKPGCLGLRRGSCRNGPGFLFRGPVNHLRLSPLVGK